MNRFSPLIALAICLLIVASATSDAEVRPAGKTLSLQEAKQLKITEIEDVANRKFLSSAMVADVKDHLDRKVHKCATGSTPVKLIIRLDNLKTVSAGSAMLLGDYVQLTGLITIYDSGGKRLVEYYNEEFRFGGGLFGIAVLSSFANDFPQKFVQSLCAGVFSVELPDDPTPETPENYDTSS